MRVSLASVPRCTKPNCGHRAPLNRHHKAHEALWLGAWAHRSQEAQWKAFVKRYYEYREEDIVRICLPHHAEIHAIYDEIIAEDLALVGLPLYLYSWSQGRRLMRKLRAACDQWLLDDTPGIDSEVYEQTKKLRRSLLKKRMRKRYPRQPEQIKRAKLRSSKMRRSRRWRKRRR